nr:unnamed protein product [Spirometra erinaceieuropaei]
MRGLTLSQFRSNRAQNFGQWCRYADDTFVVIERDQALQFKEQLNAVLLDIKFTTEEEKNNQLAFLDVLFCRNS